MQDHLSTLYPPKPAPFTSFKDVVDQLVPYHIWQIHDEEVVGSGKEKPNAVKGREEKGELISDDQAWGDDTDD